MSAEIRKVTRGDTLSFLEGEEEFFSLKETKSGAAVQLALVGELRSAAVRDLQDELIALVTAGAELEADLSGLSYLAPSGQQALLNVQQKIDSLGKGSLILQRCPPAILEEFRATGMTELLAFEEQEDDATRKADSSRPILLVRLSTGQVFRQDSSLVRIGRSRSRCDVRLRDNLSISNCHAEILQYGNDCYLKDMGSTNGTFLEGDTLKEKKYVKLRNPAFFQLANESCQLVHGELSKWLCGLGKLLLLKNEETLERRAVLQPTLMLGKDRPWLEGALSEDLTSRAHAEIFWQEGSPFIRDLDSTSGTYVNGSRAKAREAVPLHDGDRLRLGSTRLLCEIVPL